MHVQCDCAQARSRSGESGHRSGRNGMGRKPTCVVRKLDDAGADVGRHHCNSQSLAIGVSAPRSRAHQSYANKDFEPEMQRSLI